MIVLEVIRKVRAVSHCYQNQSISPLKSIRQMGIEAILS